MKSITLHNLDDQLTELITRRAREKGYSLNRTIKELLNKALGITPDPEKDKKQEFMDLFGVWSDEEYQEFEEQTKTFHKIDPDDWK
jgi:hypothetical protein